MKQAIAKVEETSGQFFIKDIDGNLIELKKGDTIYEGDIIVPSPNNNGSDTIKLLTTTSQQALIFNSYEELNFTPETMEAMEGFTFEDIQQVLQLNPIQENDESGENAEFTSLEGSRTDINSDLRKAEFLNNPENITTQDDTQEESEFTPLSGLRTDINSDLRQGEWLGISDYKILQDTNKFGNNINTATDTKFTPREGDSTDIISDLRKAQWFDGIEEPKYNGEVDNGNDAAIIASNLDEVSPANSIPIAVDDSRVIVKENGSIVTGQLLTNDIAGSDGLLKGKELKEFTYNSTTYIFDNAHTTYTINGTTLGDLTVNQDGTWELDPNGVAIGTHMEDSFTYKIVDINGDISNSATQPLMMFDADVDPNITTTTSEDTAKVILINDTSGEVIITDTSSTISKTLKTNESINITRDSDGEVIGKVVNNGDGTITFTPSKHYCGDDAVFGYEVTRSDNTLITNKSVTVTVTPTAETKTTDTNKDGYNDVITQGNKTYASINETSTYNYISLTGLNVTNEDDRGNTANPFASEITTVKLSGVPVGFKFKYNDGTTDHELTVSDVNEGVTIPFEYISTLQIKPTNYFAGEIKIKMEVITHDCEALPEAQRDEAISAPDYLIINVTNVANGINALNAAQATGDEDAGRVNGNTTNTSNSQTITAPQNGINLDITATTIDTSGREKVTTIIEEIPDGGAIYYSDTNGTVTVDKTGVVIGSNSNVTVVDNANGTWKVTIADFDNNAPLKFIPPHNSNDDYNLKVTAFTTDGNSISSTTEPKTMNVVVNGVADIPIHDDFKKLDSNETVNADVSKNIYSDVVIEDNSNTRSGATISFKDLYKEAGLDSYDSDSETLSIVITNLGSNFSIQDATGISFNGASGTSREWSFDVADLDKVVLQTSKNFSGDFSFKVKHITTENDGDSKTFEKDVNILVKPLVEATVTTNANVTEDVASQVSFAIKHQNGDTNETLDALWINKADITGKDFTLYTDVGATTVLSAGANITDEGAYYKLTGAAINSVYIKYDSNVGSANTSDSSFGIKYTVSDAVTANGETFTSTNEGASGVYNISLLSVTDTISVDTSNGTSANNIVYDDGASSVTINEAGTFSFNIDVTSADTDGSENFTRFVIENVQRGITVDDPYATMAISGGDTNIWFLDIPSQMIDASGSSYTVNFKVNQSLQHYAATSTVKITAYAKDTGSTANDIQEATKNIEFINNLHVDGGPGATSTIDVDMNIHDITVTEDTPFTLDGIIETLLPSNVTNDAIADDATVTYTLAFSNLSNVSFDKDNDSYTNSNVNSYGGEHYITVTAQKSAIQSAINTVLSNIKMIADENYNENNAASQLSFGVKLTAYVGDGWARDTTDVKTLDIDVVPVTDSITSSVAQTHVKKDNSAVGSAQEDGTTTIKITFDTVDDPNYTIVQGAADASAATTVAITHTSGIYGTLTWTGGTYTFSDVNKVANVDISHINDGSLKFTPTQDASGNVKFTYTVFAKETGADNISETSKEFTISVAAVADGLNLPELKGVGDEDTFIQIYANHTALTSLKDTDQIDNDGSETISSMFIDKVPDGFLLYIGDSHQTMATKGSITGTVTIDGITYNTYKWTINISGGIPKVWLKAPEGWSSTTDVNLTLDTLVKDGSNYTNVLKDFTVTVNSVVDGFDSVTPNNTVQTASIDVPINLNANAGDLDGSETGILTLTGFGAGDVTFKQDGVDISGNVSYNGGSDTYTITNIDLSVDKLNKLTFQKEGLQDKTISYTFKTVETDDGEESSAFSGSFTATTDNIITNIATAGTFGETDRLELSAGSVDFSTISSTSIEKIDLTQNGNTTITNITLDDVVDMTDGNNDLMIIADDANDNVAFVNDSGKTWSKGSNITYGDKTFETYTNSGDPTVTVKVSEEATVTIA